MRYLSSIAVVLLALFCHIADAQEISLSNNFVTSVAIDGNGSIWAGTEEGVNCFDGIDNKTFYKHSSELLGNEVNYLYADKVRPYIWVAVRHAGLSRINYETDEIVTYFPGSEPGSLINDDITYVDQDENGDIWASSFSRGIDKLDIEKGTFTHYRPSEVKGFDNHSVHAFKIHDNHLYIGYWSHGLSIISLQDGTSRRFRHIPGDSRSLASDEVRSLFIDSFNNLWVGTTGGLSLFSDPTGDFTNFIHDEKDPYSIPQGAIYDITMRGDRQLLVAADQDGVAELNLQNGLFNNAARKFSTVKVGNMTGRNPVRSIELDSYGNLWIGSFGSGLLFKCGSDDGTDRLLYQTGASDNFPNAVGFKANGDMLIGYGYGDVALVRDQMLLKSYPRNDANIIIRTILRDREGRIWMGGRNSGLFLLNVDGSRKVVPGTSDRTDFRVLFEDDGILWAGSNRGLMKISMADCSQSRIYGRKDGLEDILIRAIARDKRGRLWVGTYGRGLYVFDKQMVVETNISSSNGLLSSSINHLLLSRDGTMWIASGEGLVHYDTVKDSVIHIYTRNDSLANDYIRATVEDSSGNIWFSTNTGISCITTEGRIMNFDRNDGIPGGSFVSGAVSISPDGRIYFVSTDGIGVINPEKALAPKDIPPVAFKAEATEVDYRNNHMVIKFCVPDYNYSNNVNYEYRISNLDAEWRPCGKVLSFDHLPYGKHQLQVRGRLSNQDWDDNVSSLDISVKPPFWLSVWARIFYIIAVLALMAFVIFRSVAYVKRENLKKFQRETLVRNQEINDERLKFYTNITHELRTPLTLILGPLDDLNSDKSLPSAVKNKISSVRSSANQLLELINQLLDFRKTETSNKHLEVGKGNFSAFVSNVGHRFSNLSSDSSVSYILDIEPDIELYFDPTIITSVLNNLLSNARKYTDHGFIELSLHKIKDNKVALSVSDSGIGIKPEDLDRIFDRYYQASGTRQASGTGIGLALVKSLCTIHGIEISVESQLNSGSCFTLTLDAGNTYPDAKHFQMTEVKDDGEIEEESENRHERTSILVVEDNAGICDYIKESLSGSYIVKTAENGREGLRAALKGIPDIIISDIMMPVMDGIELCRAIKNDVRTSHIPVILLTAKGSDEARKEGYDAGADSYLVKPFNKQLILSRISNMLNSRKHLAAQISKGEEPNELSLIDNEFLRKFNGLVEARLSSEGTDLASIANELCMSQSTLYRKIKAVTGLSPLENIKNIRLNKAAELLRTTNLNISEICWQVGMSSPVYFRDCFKERYGMTPSAYRDEQRKK